MNAIEDKINKLYLDIMSKPNQILEVFNNFFGEDRVDMQDSISNEEFHRQIMNIPLQGLVLSASSIYNDDFPSSEYKHTRLGAIPEDKQSEILDYVDIATLCLYMVTSDIFRGGCILVHFPHVRITNEYDRFVYINHLYAKVRIMANGTLDGTFALNRSEYSFLHISNNYMHSHVRDIPFYNLTEFQIPCTGSGPINDTISSLNREFDIDIWELFCLELSKYVEVESIEGVPYHRLESLGNSSTTLLSRDKFDVVYTLPYYGGVLSNSILREFIPYFINHYNLKFDYRDGSFALGMSLTEYILTVSNAFIDWYNDQYNKQNITHNLNSLLRNNVLQRCIVANNTLYKNSAPTNASTYRQYIGNKVCTFKGQDVVLTISDINNVNEVNNENRSIILDTRAAFYILTRILQVINYRYGKSEQTDSEGNRISEEVRYF